MPYFLVNSYIEQDYDGFDDEAKLELIECADLHAVAQNMVKYRMDVTEIGSTVLVLCGENIDTHTLDKVVAPIREEHEARKRLIEGLRAEEQERATYERLKAKFEGGEKHEGR